MKRYCAYLTDDLGKKLARFYAHLFCFFGGGGYHLVVEFKFFF